MGVHSRTHAAKGKGRRGQRTGQTDKGHRKGRPGTGPTSRASRGKHKHACRPDPPCRGRTGPAAGIGTNAQASKEERQHGVGAGGTESRQRMGARAPSRKGGGKQVREAVAARIGGGGLTNTTRKRTL